jgi:ADP-ribosylation factor-like protein 2
VLNMLIQALDLSSIKSHNWKILSCSAVTGENLVKGLNWIVGDVASRIYYSAVDVPTPLANTPQSIGHAAA